MARTPPRNGVSQADAFECARVVARRVHAFDVDGLAFHTQSLGGRNRIQKQPCYQSLSAGVLRKEIRARFADLKLLSRQIDIQNSTICAAHHLTSYLLLSLSPLKPHTTAHAASPSATRKTMQSPFERDRINIASIIDSFFALPYESWSRYRGLWGMTPVFYHRFNCACATGSQTCGPPLGTPGSSVRAAVRVIRRHTPHDVKVYPWSSNFSGGVA